jgi:hypothetical protein
MKELNAGLLIQNYDGLPTESYDITVLSAIFVNKGGMILDLVRKLY